MEKGGEAEQGNKWEEEEALLCSVNSNPKASFNWKPIIIIHGFPPMHFRNACGRYFSFWLGY